MSNPVSSLPLAGVRILDLSRVLAGPWCAMVLGDLGAEVIKVEHPKRGDDTRDWGIRVGATETTYFNSVNRNKRSVCLDLQSAEGQRIARELAAQCDVVIQNFKYGGAEKLGLGYAQLAEGREDLIYCSISGYDRHGPEAARPGYDIVVQGEAGLMAMNGTADQPPLKFGVAAVDLFTGMYSAQAVLAALFERQKTGRGRHIEMALFDCGLMITSYYGLESMLLEDDPPRYGNAHPSIVPYGVFDAVDGPVVIAVGTNRQYERFCREVIERPELFDDERYCTNLVRAANRDVLVPALTRAIGSLNRAVLLERLTGAGIPCGEVLGLHDALTSQRAKEAGLLTTVPHPEAGSTHVLAPPWRFDGARLPVRSAPPPLGEGTSDVLRSLLGLSDEDVSRLKAQEITS
ncbi:CaiB/BaiF CoA transferase family protein [Caballeronia ptereochthonis]|uniref:L-carnitine dehydratase/bile acid-inducible protein F n=1 Tax=Caballeronia ptereochthonis TaxID=1777144 RepID=A0A158BD92_9BURK|nr:CoA transferase [Caballeronia ptereochthonis]SAK68031.1 L-carnitine dehydratase/bile acid-inducible protein F [Caballeronia ptereochthonis]